MSRLSRVRLLAPLALTAVAAEVGARLLAPREEVLRPVAVDPESYFNREEMRRGARFARPQLALGLAQAALELATLTWVVRRSRRVSLESSQPYLAAAAAAGGLTAGMTLVGLPLGAVARRRAIGVGLVTQPWRGWAADLLKSTAIGTTLAGGAGAGVLALIRRYPRGWWLPAAGGSIGVGALLGTLAPVLFDPVFNKFTPLPEGQLRADILDLARAAGVKVGEAYSVDASRRTTGVNAYVTGLGPTKRVVLFDTLIDRYSRDEIRVVVAHELSHVRHRDVLRSVGYAALVAPPAALATQRLSWALSPHRSTPAALPALALAVALVMAPTGLIGNRLSRAVERRADAFSLELSDAPEAFVSLERGLALQNVADLRPPRWLSAILATHPPTLERIGAAVAYSRHRERAAV